MKITKIKAFEEQMNLAIELFFVDRNPISMHSLTGACRELVMCLCKKKGIPKGINSQIKQEYKKEVENKLREAQNFFKHADKDSENELEFNFELTPYLMYDSIVMYESLMNGYLTNEMKMFNANFHISHKHLIIDDKKRKEIEEELLKIGKMLNKKEQWELMTEFFEKGGKI